jgi:hypothetical protein
MQDFWRLTNLLIALVGFVITGGVLLSKGESIPMVIVKSVLAFAVLYVVQNYLGEILSSVVGGAPRPIVTPEPKGRPKPAEEKK